MFLLLLYFNVIFFNSLAVCPDCVMHDEEMSTDSGRSMRVIEVVIGIIALPLLPLLHGVIVDGAGIKCSAHLACIISFNCFVCCSYLFSIKQTILAAELFGGALILVEQELLILCVVFTPGNDKLPAVINFRTAALIGRGLGLIFGRHMYMILKCNNAAKLGAAMSLVLWFTVHEHFMKTPMPIPEGNHHDYNADALLQPMGVHIVNRILPSRLFTSIPNTMVKDKLETYAVTKFKLQPENDFLLMCVLGLGLLSIQRVLVPVLPPINTPNKLLFSMFSSMGLYTFLPFARSIPELLTVAFLLLTSMVVSQTSAVAMLINYSGVENLGKIIGWDNLLHQVAVKIGHLFLYIFSISMLDYVPFALMWYGICIFCYIK